ncbi:hypothetical protein SAMN05444920_119125 [Nonomuraea solani]|uniref:Uncharacterized protein n=1 Tax=Nonomuraea solani TaxID=1144553 RepID=A0A1H6EW93_9ACTN|nr:hypothetical protein SAMN05444920_119125 [Nonomuraea solani]
MRGQVPGHLTPAGVAEAVQEFREIVQGGGLDAVEHVLQRGPAARG